MLLKYWKYAAGAVLVLGVLFWYRAQINKAEERGAQEANASCLAQADKDIAEAKEAVEKYKQQAEQEQVAARQQREKDAQDQVDRQQQEAEQNQKSLEEIRKHFEQSLSDDACARFNREVVPCSVE
jgi:uncharacterized protein HemX